MSKKYYKSNGKSTKSSADQHDSTTNPKNDRIALQICVFPFDGVSAASEHMTLESIEILIPTFGRNQKKLMLHATRRCTLHLHKFDCGLARGRLFCKYRCLKMSTCNAPKSSKMCSAPSAIIKIMKRELETRRCSKTCFFLQFHTCFVMFFDCPK